MSKQQKQVAILVVLVVAVPLLLWWRMSATDPGTEGVEDAAGMDGTGAPLAAGPADGTSVESRLKETEVDVDELFAKIKKVEFAYADHIEGMRNPMAPLVGPGSGSSRVRPVPGGEGSAADKPLSPDLIEAIGLLNLTGIMWSEEYPMAVVDDVVVTPGEELPNRAGIIVDSIESDRIIVRIGNTLFPLALKEQ